MSEIVHRKFKNKSVLADEQKRKDLRDHFAGLAMQAAVNALAISGSERSDDEISQAAYEMADAMLKARGDGAWE